MCLIIIYCNHLLIHFNTSMSAMGQGLTRERQLVTICKELAKIPILDKKNHFGSSIYGVCGNKMRIFGKWSHTEMRIPERVEYCTEVDGRMTDINCTRFADSRLNALRLMEGQVQNGDVITLPETSNLDLQFVGTTELAFWQAKYNACNTFTAWLKDNPNPTRGEILCDLIDYPTMAEEVYTVCCNLTLIVTPVEDVPVRNVLVEWLAGNPQEIGPSVTLLWTR